MDTRPIILHVEDDRSLQNLVRIALEQLGGYRVLTAGSGARALELAAGFAQIPAVFLTAACGPQVEAELRAAGVVEVLRKPFRPRELVQAIRRILEGA
jgi:two-component system OmpR family response regulator